MRIKSLFLLLLLPIFACADPICGPSMHFVPTGDYYSCVPSAIPTASLYGNVSGAASMPYSLTSAQVMTLLGAAPIASPSFTGHLAITAATQPTIVGCGTGSPAISATSTDNKGTITLGTSPGTCVLTFAATFTTVPDCTVSFTGGTAGAYSVAATTLTVTATGLTGAVNYSCWK